MPMMPVKAVLVLCLFLLSQSGVFALQEEEQTTQETAKSSQQESKDSIPSQFLRIQMWDGTVVSGTVSIEAIDVDTEFGALRIPIERIIKIQPGTDSLPEMKEKVGNLVEQLGSREFRERENAHRDLVGMGLLIVKLIQDFDDGGSAERKKHLTEIRKEIDELVEQAEDESEDAAVALTAGDQIITPDFSIVGKIQQDRFEVKSKIGDLRILLADIKEADRGEPVSDGKIRKTVDVAAEAFFQRSPVSTKIRVSKGDQISISASGIIQWVNWSKSSGPEGLSSQGKWNGLSNGSLTARIGTNGKLHGIGADKKFVADKAGILHLGVAMNDNYAKQNSSYHWTGKFKAKIKVQPGEAEE